MSPKDTAAFVRGLEKFLEKNEITVYRLAQMSGVSDKTIYAILDRRSVGPRLPTIEQIAKAFSLKPGEFIDNMITLGNS